MGLAAARSRGEYTSDWMLAAALAKGLNSTRSFTAPAVVNLKVNPSTIVPAGSVRSATAVVLPSDRRMIWPAGAGPVKRTS